MLRWLPFPCGWVSSTTVGSALVGADSRTGGVIDATAGRDVSARDRVDRRGVGFGSTAAGVRRMTGPGGAGGQSASALAPTVGAGVLWKGATDPASSPSGATTSAGEAVTVGGLAAVAVCVGALALPGSPPRRTAPPSA